MVFSGISYQEPGVHDGHETFENVVGWGDPLFVNHFKGQALIGASAVDVGNQNIPNNVIFPSAVTAADPAVATVPAGHGILAGDTIVFQARSGMVEINGLRGVVTAVTATTITTGILAAGFTAWTATSTNLLALAGASNILRAGLLMGYRLSASEWLPLELGVSDGTEFVRGVLYETVQMNIPDGSTRKRWRGHVMWGGPVRADRLIVPGSVQVGLGNAVAADEVSIRALMRDDYWMDDQFQQAID